MKNAVSHWRFSLVIAAFIQPNFSLKLALAVEDKAFSKGSKQQAGRSIFISADLVLCPVLYHRGFDPMI